MEDGNVTITIEDAPSVPNLKIITIKGERLMVYDIKCL